MYKFDNKKVKDKCVEWIKNWFELNGKGCNAVVGISGGVDSSVIAALCVEALGKEKVYGLILPNGKQNDIGYAYALVTMLGIKYETINISDTCDSVFNNITKHRINISSQTVINLPPRIRMSTLYAVSQSINGRVANTCNMSESYVGFDTKFGDAAGDFSPLANLTKTEVKLIGKELGLPDVLVDKIPQDGLTGKTDEESYGFSYKILDTYIRTGVCDDEEVRQKIDDMHNKNIFKLQPMQTFDPEI